MITRSGLLIGLLLSSGCAVRAPSLPPSPEASMTAVEPLTTADLVEAMDFSDAAGSERRYRDLLPRARATGPAAELELWTRLARCQGLQRRFSEALATLDTVERRLSEVDERSDLHVRLPLERGRVHRSAGDDATARPLFDEARRHAQRIGHDPLWLDAVHMQAIAAEPDEALALQLEAIEVAERSDLPAARAWLGPLYNNTGWTLLERGDAERALSLFEAGVAFRKQAGKPGPLRVARHAVGAALRKLGRCDEALALQQEVRAEWAEDGEVDGFVEEEIAECLLTLGRSDEARPHFAAAYGALSKQAWLVEEAPDRLARLKQLGGG